MRKHKHLISASLAGLLLAGNAFADAPAITGPVAVTAQPGSPSHNYPFFASNKDLAAHGYVEQEYFLRGTASRYDIPGPLATGKAADSHPYATRIVVRRPADPKKFNGTVIVEWDNVSNNFDAENVWFWDADHLIRAGYAFVGVSAQKVGVEYLKKWNGTRYSGLDLTADGAVTDDSLSYDVFTQAGEALRHPAPGQDVLGGLKPKHLIATGESQGAGRLVNYINAVQPLTREYDGFVLLSSGSPVRSDLNAPVFKVLTEYDVAVGEAAQHQQDTAKLRTWEIAGTSHMDHQARIQREPLELRDTLISSETGIAQPCNFPDIGTRVPTHYVLSSAIDKTVRWIEGTAPPSAPTIETSAVNPRPGKSVIARDSAGLALGGIRLSQLSVPTATNVGLNIGPGGCEKWGYSVPYDLAALDARYPSHKAYVAAVTKQTEANLKAGYILAADAATTIREAQESGVGR